MSKTISLKISFLVVFLSFACFASAKKTPPFRPLPAMFDGSMSAVKLDNGDFFEIPDSLEVISGSYMSRHGARYLSSEKKILPLEKGIAEARATGTLTKKGERFARLVQSVRDSNEGRWGLLSAEGIKEQQVFGHVFAKKILNRFNIAENEYVEQNAVSSFVPRVVETMYSFNYNTLISYPKTRISNSEGPEYDNLTRFFISNPKYREYLENGEWRGIYDNFVKTHISATSAREILGKIPGKDEKFYRDYALQMYGMLQSLRVTGLAAPTTEWMSAREYENCWKAANLDMYLKRSLNPVSHLACEAAVPLLGYLLQARQGEVVEVFGHAETLLPLVALMGLPDAVYINSDFDDLSDHWQNFEIAPLGSNVAIISLSNPASGKDYMMVFLNGKAVRPMPGSDIVVDSDTYHLFLANRVSSFTSDTPVTPRIAR